MRQYTVSEAQSKLAAAQETIREAEWVIRDAVAVTNAWLEYCNTKDFNVLEYRLASLAGAVRRFMDGDDR